MIKFRDDRSNLLLNEYESNHPILFHNGNISMIMIEQIFKELRRKTLREKISIIRWYCRYFSVRNPKILGPIAHDQENQQRIIHELQHAGIDLIPFIIDLPDYYRFLKQADYGQFPYYDWGKGPNFQEKSLEHYLSFVLLNLREDDVYIDIANDYSPTPEIFEKISGCQAYRQDIAFPEGFHGKMIGSNAGDIPVADGFASRMALHCSFEHFEKDSDINFIREAARILRPGGRLCIVPLYLHTVFAILTNLSNLKTFNLYDEAVLYCDRHWGNRFGRFYDVSHLQSRVLKNLGKMKLKIFSVENVKTVSESCYLRFIAIIEKPM